MLSLIQRVGELLIQVEVNRSLGDKERVSDLYLDAYDEVFNAGLDACLMDKTKKYGVFLFHYPEFVKPWDDGYNEGMIRISRNGCGYCQDPTSHICPYHG
ncbi:hypothetical protein [Alkalimarinus alittae]|uniref:Uncharacterized protein n=1 Tax=Alkalimarinus alittae TaxID=2961619 RepID=A0ABY6N5J7_9ALTE|nr:hypothetical protein [Alkalimarinus alittae]UZE97262.1 hypothetical protein NKI27_05795 [Alkalimarinus alittae]